MKAKKLSPTMESVVERLKCGDGIVVPKHLNVRSET
jgi:hypothetical protein